MNSRCCWLWTKKQTLECQVKNHQKFKKLNLASTKIFGNSKNKKTTNDKIGKNSNF